MARFKRVAWTTLAVHSLHCILSLLPPSTRACSALDADAAFALPACLVGSLRVGDGACCRRKTLGSGAVSLRARVREEENTLTSRGYKIWYSVSASLSHFSSYPSLAILTETCQSLSPPSRSIIASTFKLTPTCAPAGGEPRNANIASCIQKWLVYSSAYCRVARRPRYLLLCIHACMHICTYGKSSIYPCMCKKNNV